ncbi:MAG: OmpA family protein [Pseudomonadota bacterium]|nr:OmpA family protein [Pseudomonadota bacterium]
MKRVMYLGVVAAAGIAGNTAYATDDTGAFYISPMLQYHLLDQERISKDNFGGQIGLGFNLLHGFAVEADVNRANFSISGLTADQRLTGYSVDVIKKFFPDSSFRPYVLVGAGEMDDTLTKAPHTFHTSLAEAGVGLLTGLGSQTGSTRVQLRTEAKYRLEFANAGLYGPKDPSDLIFGVGVQMMFGAPEPPPPPPPEPKIVEVQAPPPPPPPPAGPVDSDGDGVPDSIDQCPDTPKGTPVDAVGCPIKDEIKLQGVNFATGSADLIPTSDFVLSYAVQSLKKNPTLVIEVDGHTDSVGSASKNLALSQARAETVMRYLREHGVTNTMTAKGYGKDRPIADNKTSDGRLQNRRVTLKIVGGF